MKLRNAVTMGSSGGRVEGPVSEGRWKTGRVQTGVLGAISSRTISSSLLLIKDSLSSYKVL